MMFRRAKTAAGRGENPLPGPVLSVRQRSPSAVYGGGIDHYADDAVWRYPVWLIPVWLLIPASATCAKKKTAKR